MTPTIQDAGKITVSAPRYDDAWDVYRVRDREGGAPAGSDLSARKFAAELERRYNVHAALVEALKCARNNLRGDLVVGTRQLIDNALALAAKKEGGQ